MNEDYVVVFAGSAIEAEVMRSSLEAAGIDCFLKDEWMGNLAPWNAAGGGMAAVKVMVDRDSEREARALLSSARAADGGSGA